MDIAWSALDPDDRLELSEFLSFCGDVFDEYSSHFGGSVTRLAGVLSRLAEGEGASQAIASHFLKDRWLNSGKLTALADIEINIAIQGPIGAFVVNNWIKCRSGSVSRIGVPAPVVPGQPVVFVERRR